MGFSSLNIGASALVTAQRAVDTAAHNIANANTEGYTRQRLSIQAGRPGAGTPGMAGSGMLGTGVQVLGIDRLRDRLADAVYRVQSSTAGAADARTAMLDRAQSVLGPFGGGASESLDEFWASWDQLSLHPADPAARSGVINAAESLATSLRDSASSLQQISKDIGLALGDTVTQVNALAREVASLNQSITDAVTNGLQPNDLLDKRDVALDKLATLAGATTSEGPHGSVNVNLGMVPLVRGTSVSPIALANAGTPTGTAYTVVFADTNAPAKVGGTMGGYLEVNNVDIPAFLTKLNTFATTLRDQVNAAHTTGFDPTGAAGGVFFTGTGAADFALAPTMNAAKIAAASTGAPPKPNDGSKALALANLRMNTIPALGGVTLNGELHSIASMLGAAASDAMKDAAAAVSVRNASAQVRAATNAVSTDEEMVELVKFQHAYDAAARVISIVDGMFDTLINRTGAGR